MSEWWESIVWASPQWRVPAAVVAVLAGLAVLASYAAIRGPRHVRWLGALLKAAAVATLVFCLLEPMRTEERPRPGANLFVVLADNSQSGSLQDARQSSIQQQIEEALGDEQWQTRLGQDFDVRRYRFDGRLQSVGDWEGLDFSGQQSSLAAALEGVCDRFQGQPLAGVMLLTDGNATDNVDAWLQAREAGEAPLPPLYPVRFRAGKPAPDASIQRVTVRQTNFEDSPVLISAEVAAAGFADNAGFVVALRGADNELVDSATVELREDEPAAVELRVRPDAAGLHVYRLTLEPAEETKESTNANNQRLVMIQREAGPYRLLYVAGRPNWEFKFLRRATEEDGELDLLGLLRIARKEPKFLFGDREIGDSNPLFQGFDDKDQDEVEQYDQPVLYRVGVTDADELRDGFPQDAESLFDFEGIILDDLESSFFTPDQLSLIKEFVSQRGGGLLMLGGAGSFQSGGYKRTPLGDMLPIYLNDDRPTPPDAATRYQLQLSRDGWLQPWVRVRSSEAGERKRLDAMPVFQTLNVADRIKPGATVLATVNAVGGAAATPDSTRRLPALVAQRYGKGRAAALLVGDYWKWATMREEGGERDLEKAWRQMLRWLISDVPRRVAAAATRESENEVAIQVDVRDEAFRPQDNAELEITVATPDGRSVSLAASPAGQPGAYSAKFASREAGAYTVAVSAAAPDGSDIGDAETGWTHEPSADEYQALTVNRDLLADLARRSGGAVAPVDSLYDSVAGIAAQKAIVNETKLTHVWHRWYVFVFAAICLAGEWGLRRFHGLP